jgi:hypothetical protein
MTDTATTCTRDGRPVADGAYCCAACVEQTNVNLDWIADLHDELETTLTRQDRVSSGTGGRASAETPLPLNLHASDVGHRHALTTWARIVIDERGFAPPDDNLTEIARFIRGVTGWIARQDWGPECFDELSRVAVDLGRAIDSPPPMISLGTCDADNCEGELRAHQGAAFVRCPECRESYDVAKRKDQLLARADHRRFNAASLARILTALGSLGPDGRPVVREAKWIYNRVQWKLLAAAGEDDSGRPTYSLGAARRLHDQDIQQAILKAARAAEKETQAA